MKILLIEPNKTPRIEIIGDDYTDMQRVVGGTFCAIYPFDDDIALVCNDDGLLLGLTPNRVLLNHNHKPMAVIVGTCFLVGLGEEDFVDFPDDLTEKYKDVFDGFYADIYEKSQEED